MVRIRNRKLEREAKRVHREILSRNEANFEALIAEKFASESAEKKPLFNKRVVFAWATSCVAIVVVLIAFLSVYLPAKDNTPPQNYLGISGEEEEISHVKLSEVNESMKHAVIKMDYNNSYDITLSRDKIYANNLFYNISFASTDVLMVAQFYIVVHSQYGDPIDISAYDETLYDNGYAVNYKMTSEFIPDGSSGMYMTDCSAKIDTGDERIYFTLSFISFEEVEFLDLLHSVIAYK